MDHVVLYRTDGRGFGIGQGPVRSADHVVMDMLSAFLPQEGANAAPTTSSVPAYRQRAIDEILDKIRAKDKDNGIW